MLHYATFYRSQRKYTFDNCFVYISDRKAPRQGDDDIIQALYSQSMDEQYMANIADLRKRKKNLLTLQCKRGPTKKTALLHCPHIDWPTTSEAIKLDETEIVKPSGKMAVPCAEEASSKFQRRKRSRWCNNSTMRPC